MKITLFKTFIILILLMFLFGFILFIIDFEEFHEDYKCSIINDYEYFEKHNCKRFIK